MNYTVHPGEGLVAPKQPEEYIDAGTLASLYGLLPGEYTVGGPVDAFSIHLFPRPDGKYRSIKKRLGDNGTTQHLDLPANFKKNKDKEHIL
jgi:hypothetical protein